MPGPLRDRLPVSPPYSGWIADAYEAWIPLGTTFDDDELLARRDRHRTGAGTGAGLRSRPSRCCTSVTWPPGDVGDVWHLGDGPAWVTTAAC